VELTAEQVRLLGCLLEKGRTTPDDYPLTTNALMRAANQTTSRDPVVAYDQALVERTAASLKEAGMLRFVYSQSNRSTRYREVLGEAWGVSDDELAILALLMLRGPQTVGELKTRSERLASFAGLDDVRRVLDDLAGRDEPMVVQLPRLAGHKEARWAHLLSGPIDEAALAASAPSPAAERVRREDANASRLDDLERAVAELREQMTELRRELGLDVGGAG
jgi:uncharacterized protein YceH (UPF0502 family)